MLDQIVPNTSIRYSRVGKNAQLLHEISIDDINGFQTQVDNLSRSPNLTIGGGYKTIEDVPSVSKVGNFSQKTVENQILPEVELTVIPTIPRPNLSVLNDLSKSVDDNSDKKELVKGIAIIVVLLTVITIIAILK